MLATGQTLPFAAAALGADTTPVIVRNTLDRGQASLPTEVGRTGLGWRRFSPIDVLRIALQTRLVRYGVASLRADAILREHFDGRIRTLLQASPDADMGLLPMVLGVAVLVVLRDGRAGMLQGLPGDALHPVTAGGPTGETFTGGQPHPGSEWLAAGITDGSIEDFAVLRLATIAHGVVRRLGKLGV